ncbi:uncharacterized protein LOC122868072 isoform X2 [Siniperca chuatsi]|nr:uncharacterized protein LOC122868072 isoform X2 [Siniperca chuatsi]
MAMRGGKYLLLLAVFVVLARCQQMPQVSMSPKLKYIFSGDLFNLSCESTSENTVKWYVNNTEERLQTNKTWKIAVAAPKHSGVYQCESNGKRSGNFSIKVLEYTPSASLIIKTGLPVMRTEGSVVLELENEDGLWGWKCWVKRGEKTKMIKLRLKDDNVSLAFQPNRLNDPETIFWCTDENEEKRSNQITVRTSVKDLALEMDRLPAVVGESLTLSCHVWGTNQISDTVFYKDNQILQHSSSPTHNITVTEDSSGRYKCNATYTYKARTRGPPYQEGSDFQDLYVQEPPMKAVLSEKTGMCSCPHCPSGASYRWYHKNDGQSWALMSSNQSMMPKDSGTYACRAVWVNGRSLLSNNVFSDQSSSSTSLIVLMILGVVILIVVVAVYIYCKKRRATGAIYEDVQMKPREKGDDKYETLQKPRGAQKEGEYDTLHPEAPGTEMKEGEYQPLKKEEMKGEVYHTLGMEGAAGGEGAYEALKKEGMKEGVYHSLGMEGAAGGEGAYEALKKEGMKEGVYHSLGMEGAGGGHEAVRKDKDSDYEIVKEKM